MRNQINGLLLAAALLSAGENARAQVHAATADPTDVTTIDGIITALYATISGPAGPREWYRFHSLFLPGASLLPAQPRPDTMPPPRPMSPMEYQDRVTPYFASNPFYEVEAARRVERFGTVAQVWSTYESRRDPAAEPFERGINSIQLVWHDRRWWVTSIVWDRERADNPIPSQYLRTPR